MKLSKNKFLLLICLIFLILGINAVNAEDLENRGDTSNVVSFNVESTSTSVIYVNNSYSGGVEDGSLSSPYKTIESAVSNAANGSEIYIANGDYIESGEISLDKSLSFIGESQNVNISSSSTEPLFSLTEDGVNLVFSNLTFKNINGGTSFSAIRIGGDGTLEMSNCNFYNCSGKYGAIQIWTTSTAVIDNCKFQNISSTKTGGAGAIYTSGSGVYNITNCLVDNTRYNASSGYMYGSIYNYNSRGILNIINTTIKNSQGTANSVIYNKGDLYIINSKIENNIVNKSEYGYQGESIFYNMGNLYINSSVISNNSGSDYVFYQGNFDCIISGSAFLNNNYSDSFNDATITDNYNWWGTNDKPNDFVENWIIMDYTIDSTSPTVGEEITITANFNKYMDDKGTYDLTNPVADGIKVEFSDSNGKIDSEAFTVDGKASVSCTVNADDVIYIKSGNLTLNVPITVQTPSKSIYVSTKGNDANNGSQESPVKTIAKAIELSKDLGEPVDIIIEEGTYQENYLNISDDLSFIGEGEVKIDGSNSQNSLFIIKGGNVLFENINFQNVNLSSISGTNGGAILIQADSNRQTVYANVTINNCNFNNLSVASQGGAVYVEYGSGNLNINNSNFTNCSTDSSNGGAIKVDMGYNLFNTHIENSNFKDNYANNAAVYIRGNSSTIINSIFDGNGAKYYPGALQIYNTTTLIDGCTFINNYADSSSSNTVSAIHINEGSNDNNKVTIKNSIFENNNATTDSCPSIYVNKGTLDISNSYIDSALAIKTYYYYSSYSQSTTQGVAIANNNWWGTNNPRSVVNGNNITIDSWVIMSVNADIPDELKVGDVVEININFNHVNTTTGEIAELNGSIPKEFNVSINANGGTAAKSVTTVNGETSFNYTVTEITNNFVNLTVDKTSTIFNVVKVVYNGTIYVSTTGNDNNIGSSDAPVKTIAKAIELATAEGGSGQIIIKEGTYSEYGLEINGNLTITGEDEVIINASSQGRLFSIGENSNVVFNNLALTGASSNFGAVIYNAKSSSSVNLTNVKIYNNTVEDGMSSTLSVLYNLGGNLTIVNSSIYDNGENGLIYTEGNLIINNSNIYNNIANAYSSVYGAVYVYDGNAYIYNSTFRNITSNQGTIFGYTDTHLIIENSLFEENIATVGDGAAIHSNNNLTVSGSSFIRNSGTGFGSDGGAIYSSGTAIITSSIFIDNNVSSDNEGSAIYNYGEQLTVNNCVLISNSSASVIYNDGGEESSVNAQYNWWGTNNNPQDLVGSASGYWPFSLINVSNWVILNVTTNPSQEFMEGNSITINVDLNHYYDNETGSINELTTKLPDGFSVSVESENGTFTSENIIINEGVGSTVYIPISGDNRITFNDNIVFEFNADEQPEGPTTYTVTNSTFFNFFDEDGNLLANVSEGSVLNFVGEFGGLPSISSITIDREMTINGVNAKLNDIFVQLNGSNIVMDNFTIVISGESGLDNGVIIMGDSIKLVNNFINVTTPENGGYAIIMDDVNGVVLDNNTVYYNGNGSQDSKYYGVSISSSNNIELTNNDFEFWIPSLAVGYDASYNSDVKSLGLLIESSENYTLVNNSIGTYYNGKYEGSYDSMYGVYISKSSNGLISGNNITIEGREYAYAVYVIGGMDSISYEYVYCDNVNVTNNNIVSTSAGFGSWGIQAQVGSGVFSDNDIDVVAEDAVYGIYTEGMMGDTSFDMVNNTISASANSVWAISSAGQNETIGGNNITAKGNYTIGIYSGPFGSDLVAIIENNTISSLGSGIGDITGGMPDKVVTGIYVLRQGASITDNNVTTTGNYTVIIESDSGVIVRDNYLIADTAKGNPSVLDNGSNTVENNLPMYTGIIYVDVNGNDLNDGSIDAPVKTIANAIELALVEGGSGHIIIGSGVFNEYGLENSEDLLIEGAGSGVTIINGSNLGEIFTNSFASLTLRGISLINGYNTGSSGGAIVSMGNLTLDDVIIANSKSTTGNGGAIYAVGNVHITDSKLINNTASGNGGAIYIDEYKSLDYPSSLIIENSELSDNTAESTQFGGGAIYMQLIDGDKLISNTSFTNNKANAGGAIFMQQSEGDFTITDSTFESNEITSSQDTYGGGAICLIGETYAKEGNVIITGSKFINNNATTSAGAIFTRNVDLNISKSFIINNKDAEGSAIVRDVTEYYPTGATVIVEDNWWGNTADNLTFNSNALNNIDTPESWLVFNMFLDGGMFVVGDTAEVIIDLNYNQHGELAVSEGLPDDNIRIIYDGISQFVSLENGIAKVNIVVADLEDNNVKSELYGIVIQSQLFAKLNPSISVSVEDIPFGENATIVVNLNQDATGNVVITIGNFTETVELIDGTAMLTVENLNIGRYDVSVSYSGDSKYVSAVSSTSFNVNGFVLDGSDVVMYYKNGTEYVVVLTDVSGNYIANKTLTFTINGVEYTRVTDENGSASISIGLNAGEYVISVIYNDYPSVNITNTITVLPTVDGEDIVKYYRNDTQYSAIILDGHGNPVAGQEVSFNINGVFYYITTDENGRASLNINLNPGNYTLTVNNTLTGELYSNNVEVLSTVIVYDLVKYFHNDSQYNVTVLDAQGNPIEGKEVSFNVNGIIYTRVSDENGMVSLNINLSPGEYIMTVTDEETGLNVSSNITVLSTIISSDLVKYFRNGTQYHAKLVDGQGNPIEGRILTFNINGVFYNRETNSEGIATLNINLNPGKYIITVIDQYSGLMMSNNIEVLPVLIGENQIIHYASGETYNITLLDGQGNPLADENISININGIFYNRVTDANGIAKLNINLLPGEYIATAYYGEANVSNQITVI